MQSVMRLYEQFAVVMGAVSARPDCVMITSSEANAVLSAVELATKHPAQVIQVELRKLCWSNEVWFAEGGLASSLIESRDDVIEVAVTTDPQFIVMVGMQPVGAFAEEHQAIERAQAVAAVASRTAVFVQMRQLIWANDPRFEVKLAEYAAQLHRRTMLLRSALATLATVTTADVLRQQIERELGLPAQADLQIFAEALPRAA